ncbi:MAG: tRNA (adenosine(37)-N6)-threonylcarbamoyltransferase complex transferase subunit TsaD [Parcubacteria group bacterium]|nr:tRNA (adenosine(37)-N6)-threonylcarbamoyltransferase complex transferase subunit TsaD [Parcubacteria group bacterium]
MRVLGIETSCDETAVAIVTDEGGRFVLEKNQLASQARIHAQYGGVVPEVAAREHAAIIFDLMEKGEIPRDGEGIDVVAVTAGPGLVPALRIGVELGKALAWAWGKPLVAVNHIEGHIYSVWFEKVTPSFPALCLLVSGGHTELIVMRGHGQYELLGMTRDDAAGEAFDKVAKLLGLAYPGGPEISRAALKGNPAAINFPRPMLESGDFDFSFSGLKTAVRVRREQFPEDTVEDVAASFQQAAIDTLVTKTLRAAQKIQPASVILSGGVSANKLLRETLHDQLMLEMPSATFHAPDLSLTGDNAAMIALAGLMKARRGEYVDPLTLVADPNMRLA